MTVIMHILIAIVAAKLAAEAAERVKVPAVVGEIVAGLIIGPSALGLLPSDDVLLILGEIGVILLLFDVGLEIDLGELLSVGRAALTVAVVGVVVPFALGFGVGLAFDMSGNEALFVGAALTATSVGITARVFGDLRALATVEARTVLGAAVADDVIGLVILTVVVRLVTVGSISAIDVGQVVFVAVAFLVGASVLGVRLVPPAFEWLARHSRASGTLMVFGLALALALSKLAEVAKLAPIVGAFVAGISLSSSTVAERVHRELAPVGQLLIPVFFLQIGVEADIGQFAEPAVLGLAGTLLLVAVVGKLASAAGLIGSPGDRLLVGMAMIPRGEVGLIFATIGLQQAVFGENVYASVLLVVLATTLLTPPLLRWRLQGMGTAAQAAAPGAVRPPGGWLIVEPRPLGAVVDLVAEPPPEETLAIALRAARRLDDSSPGPRLMDWLASQEPTGLAWDASTRSLFSELLEHAQARSWRFLSVTRVLERSLPELAVAVNEREDDAYGFDPMAGLDWPTLAELRDGTAMDAVSPAERERLLVAAAVLDATQGDADRSVQVGRAVAERMGLEVPAAASLVGLVRDAPVFLGAARRLDAFGEERDRQLAQHLGQPDHVRALLALSLAMTPGETTVHQRMHALADRLLAVLDHPELASPEATTVLDVRREEARRLLDADARDIGARRAEDRVRTAPRSLVLGQTPEVVAQLAELAARLGDGRGPLVASHPPDGGGPWRIDVAAPDQRGLLAHLARALHGAGHDVGAADLGTWDDGTVVVTFRTDLRAPVSDAELDDLVRHGLRTPLISRAHADAVVEWDDRISPWHTVCRVRDHDEPGLLADLTAALATCGADIHAAHVTSAAGMAVDTFDVSNAAGGRLDEPTRRRIEGTIVAGVTDAGHRPRRRFSLVGRR